MTTTEKPGGSTIFPILAFWIPPKWTKRNGKTWVIFTYFLPSLAVTTTKTLKIWVWAYSSKTLRILSGAGRIKSSVSAF